MVRGHIFHSVRDQAHLVLSLSSLPWSNGLELLVGGGVMGGVMAGSIGWEYWVGVMGGSNGWE